MQSTHLLHVSSYTMYSAHSLSVCVCVLINSKRTWELSIISKKMMIVLLLFLQKQNSIISKKKLIVFEIGS